MNDLVFKTSGKVRPRECANALPDPIGQRRMRVSGRLVARQTQDAPSVRTRIAASSARGEGKTSWPAQKGLCRDGRSAGVLSARADE